MAATDQSSDTASTPVFKIVAFIALVVMVNREKLRAAIASTVLDSTLTALSFKQPPVVFTGKVVLGHSPVMYLLLDFPLHYRLTAATVFLALAST